MILNNQFTWRVTPWFTRDWQASICNPILIHGVTSFLSITIIVKLEIYVNYESIMSGYQLFAEYKEKNHVVTWTWTWKITFFLQYDDQYKYGKREGEILAPNVYE